MKNEMNGFPRPLYSATRRFCGFPIGLTTLPVVTAKQRVRSRSFVERLCRDASERTIGVPMIARVSFIRKADRIPMEKMIAAIRVGGVCAMPKRREEMWRRYPLLNSASPTTNIPKRKTIISRFIDFAASGRLICPVKSTISAPRSITCQILNFSLPSWRTVMRMKTRPSTMTGK